MKTSLPKVDQGNHRRELEMRVQTYKQRTVATEPQPLVKLSEACASTMT